MDLAREILIYLFISAAGTGLFLVLEMYDGEAGDRGILMYLCPIDKIIEFLWPDSLSQFIKTVVGYFFLFSFLMIMMRIEAGKDFRYILCDMIFTNASPGSVCYRTTSN